MEICAIAVTLTIEWQGQHHHDRPFLPLPLIIVMIIVPAAMVIIMDTMIVVITIIVTGGRGGPPMNAAGGHIMKREKGRVMGAGEGMGDIGATEAAGGRDRMTVHRAGDFCVCLNCLAFTHASHFLCLCV